jgi:hypothetical protein
LKAAIVAALQQRLRKHHQQQVEVQPSQVRQEPVSVQPEEQTLQLKPLSATALEAWKEHYITAIASTV